MINSLKLTKYVLEILKLDENLVKYIPYKSIYPIDARLSSKFPFAVIQRTSVIPANAKDGTYEDTVYFSLMIVDDNYIGSVNIAEAIRTALDRRAYKTDEINIRSIRLVGASETLYDESFIQQLDFIATIQN